mmetsp:Transcript_53343/g.104357  ORF Transcript_53343/g.104357 Transcript_53343/m.104357 type:complete len:375 (+) Transcript_53343:227-1351(+)
MSAEEPAILSQWRAEQERIAAKITLSDDSAGFVFPWDSENTSGKPPLSLIGGIDISFVPESNLAVASLVVLTFPGLKVVYQAMRHCEMTLPYIAGFLAFREVGPMEELWEQLKRENPKLVPQIVFIDGNGIIHPRGCGLASHFGVVVDVPTVGCAKKLFVLPKEGISQDLVDKMVKTQIEEGKKGELIPLKGKSGRMWGFAALTGNATANPIFISPGHRISAESAARLTQMIAPTRVPEPTRQADKGSRSYISKHFPSSSTPKPAKKPSKSSSSSSSPEGLKHSPKASPRGPSKESPSSSSGSTKGSATRKSPPKASTGSASSEPPSKPQAGPSRRPSSPTHPRTQPQGTGAAGSADMDVDGWTVVTGKRKSNR